MGLHTLKFINVKYQTKNHKENDMKRTNFVKRKQGILCLMIAVFALSVLGCSQTILADVEQPSEENIKGVVFSQESGLYEQDFSLILSSDIPNGVIRYTLDGSDPTEESAVYTEAIPITDRTGEDNVLSAIELPRQAGQAGGMEPNNVMRKDMNGMEPFDKEQGESMPPNWEKREDMHFDREEDKLQGEILLQKEGQPQEGEIRQREQMGGNAAATTPAENVFKGTVVKAQVFSESGEILSDIATASYFVSEDIFTRYGDLPIVSVVTDSKNFFDEETGIYYNYSESGSDWERPVYFEMFENDGTSVISQNMGVRINGGTTRSLAQKALRFYAKKDYDQENTTIEYELFEGLTKSNSDEPLTTFKRIILRSSGNDNSGSLFRDALMQSLVSDLNVDTQATRHCVAFVNGEFWGIYNIRERYDDHYFANHYSIDTDNVAMLEISQDSDTVELSEGDESNIEYYNQMIQFFENNTMTDEDNYKKAQEYLDIDNFIDYYITYIYSANSDWPANNNVFWRYQTENGGYDQEAEWYKDGRFRWVIKDMDWGFGLMSDVSNNTLIHALNENSPASSGRGGGHGFTSDESTLMFRKLLENDQFKSQFINRFCDVMNTNYDSDTVIKAIEEMKGEIAPAIEEQSNRYPSSVRSVESWENSIQKMIDFATKRGEYMRGFLQSRFSLGDEVTLSAKTDSSKGYIRVNNTDINTGTRGVSDSSSWSGGYFADTTQNITAVPLEGHNFVKLVVTDMATGEKTEYSESSIALKLSAEETIVEAVFE